MAACVGRPVIQGSVVAAATKAIGGEATVGKKLLDLIGLRVRCAQPGCSAGAYGLCESELKRSIRQGWIVAGIQQKEAMADLVFSNRFVENVDDRRDPKTSLQVVHSAERGR